MGKLYQYYQTIESLIKNKPIAQKSNFCYYPFFQVLLTADGKYKPCCKYKNNLSDKESELNVKNNHTLKDAWNSDDMQKLRTDMLDNNRNAGCIECWREEDMNIKSMRYDSYHYNISKKQINQPQFPIRLEINASNICNLKCRICSSFASTKWQTEEIALFGKSEPKNINLNIDNYNQLKEWLPNIKELGLFGGEPFLSEENLKLLQYCVEKNLAKNITIIANTNGTVYNDTILETLKNFKKVYLNFSIDDIEERFEYQRKGAKWNEVVHNMQLYMMKTKKSEFKHIKLNICCTVNNMNIFYISEYTKYINTHFPSIAIYWNLLYNPIEYSVQILPKAIKTLIKNKLIANTNNKIKELNNRSIETILTYLNEEEVGDIYDFFKIIDRHDNYRKEKFSIVFPEYWKLLKEYQTPT